MDLVNGEIVEEWICIDPTDMTLALDNNTYENVVVYKLDIVKNNLPYV